MKIIQTKRVYQDYDPSDGFRVLADRLWPRGVKKEELHYDLWAKEIAPSNDLRKWFHANIEDNWANFESLYLDELRNSDYAVEFLKQIEPYQTVTLLYAARDTSHSHTIVLRKYIENHYR